MSFMVVTGTVSGNNIHLHSMSTRSLSFLSYKLLEHTEFRLQMGPYPGPRRVTMNCLPLSAVSDVEHTVPVKTYVQGPHMGPTSSKKPS